MIQLVQHPEGVILPVRAHAAARTNAVKGEQGGALRVSVSQAPEKGKANKAIARLLCRTLNLKGSQLQLLSGDTASCKRFLVRDLTVDQLALRLQALPNPSGGTDRPTTN